MRRLGHSGKVDSTHVEAVEHLRKHGWYAYSTAPLGHGFPDVIASKAGVTALIEMKRDEKQKLTPDQVKFRQNWGGIVITAISGEDALRQLDGR